MERFKQWGCNTPLSIWWHNYAPPLIFRKRFYGSYVYMNLRDNIHYISKSTSDLERWEGDILEFPRYTDGVIWDVGANVGLFSVRAAQMNRRCVAFELSPKACGLMQMTKLSNSFDFIIVDRPLTVATHSYVPPDNASAENQVSFTKHSGLMTLSYREAERLYGQPSFIKMDIEGGELEFFNSMEFKSWLLKNAIVWLVEIHRDKVGYMPLWEDVPYSIIDADHYLYCKDISTKDRLTEAIKNRLS